jgi:hypothetical protein
VIQSYDLPKIPKDTFKKFLLVHGEMPKAQTKLIAAWAELHKDELLADWELAIHSEPIYKIEPLR